LERKGYLWCLNVGPTTTACGALPHGLPLQCARRVKVESEMEKKPFKNLTGLHLESIDRGDYDPTTVLSEILDKAYVPNKEVAERLGISDVHLSRIKKNKGGTTALSEETVKKIADEFKLPAWKLLLFNSVKRLPETEQESVLQEWKEEAKQVLVVSNVQIPDFGRFDTLKPEEKTGCMYQYSNTKHTRDLFRTYQNRIYFQMSGHSMVSERITRQNIPDSAIVEVVSCMGDTNTIIDDGRVVLAQLSPKEAASCYIYSREETDTVVHEEFRILNRTLEQSVRIKVSRQDKEDLPLERQRILFGEVIRICHLEM
jgi:transcriptional regulator with XRE-family HTH domain